MKQPLIIGSSIKEKNFPQTLIHHWMGWALVFFFLVSILGISLRYYFIGEVPGFGFNNLKHAHSHGAMLGWAYLASTAMLITFFIKRTARIKGYIIVLSLTVLSVFGMIISFSFEGYGFYSISFSALHVLASYYFAYLFLTDLKGNTRTASFSHKLARWSIYWMLISTLGLWAVGPVSALLGGLHPAYFMSIQWYLHFQFIGWFTFAVLAGCFKLLESHQISVRLPDSVFMILQLSVILTYALSVSWSNPSEVLFYLNATGVLLQAWAFYFLLKALFKGLNDEAINGRTWMKWLLKAGLVVLAFRVFIQMMAVIPAVAEIAYTLRMFVIAFIHLMMMGTFTLIVVPLMQKSLYYEIVKVTAFAWMLYFIAFVMTEILLLGQGTMLWAKLGFIPDFYYYLLYISLLFPVALFLATVNHYLIKKKNIPSFHFQKTFIK